VTRLLVLSSLAPCYLLPLGHPPKSFSIGVPLWLPIRFFIVRDLPEGNLGGSTRFHRPELSVRSRSPITHATRHAIIRMLKKAPSKSRALEVHHIHIAQPPSRNTSGDGNVVDRPDIFKVVLPVVTTDAVVDLLIRSILPSQRSARIMIRENTRLT
jgi:hypothetical protein